MSEQRDFQISHAMPKVLDLLAERELFTFYTGSMSPLDIFASMEVIHRRDVVQDSRFQLRLAIGCPGQDVNHAFFYENHYREIERKADHVVLLEPRYNPLSYKHLIRYLVDQCGVCIYFSGGYCATPSRIMEYAQSKHLEMIDLADYV